MKIGDYFYLFSVEVENEKNEMVKRIDFCDSIEKAGEAAQKYEKKLKKNESIRFTPYTIGQSKADPPSTCSNVFEYLYPPENNKYTKSYYEEIKREIRWSAPDSKYTKYCSVHPRITTPYKKKNNNISAYVFTASGGIITRRTKKSVTKDDVIVSYKKALCLHCWNNVKHCTCQKLPTIFTETDAHIQPALILLNRKGYFTTYSCEGHSWLGHSAYIAFENHYKFPVELPEFWFEDRNSLVLNYKDALVENENFEQVMERKMKELEEWAERLPEREESFGKKI